MLLADPAFSPFIYKERIGVVGFSLGGATALGLAGVRFDGSVQDANCTTGPDAADCAFFRMGDVRFADYPGFSADARDPRVTRAVVIDPGFGGAVDPKSLQDALAGMTLINLGDANRLGAVDVSPDVTNLQAGLPMQPISRLPRPTTSPFWAPVSRARPSCYKRKETIRSAPSPTVQIGPLFTASSLTSSLPAWASRPVGFRPISQFCGLRFRRLEVARHGQTSTVSVTSERAFWP